MPSLFLSHTSLPQSPSQTATFSVAHSYFGHVPLSPNALLSPEGLAARGWSLAKSKADSGWLTSGCSPRAIPGGARRKPQAEATPPAQPPAARPLPGQPSERLLTPVQPDDLGQAVIADQLVQRDGHGAPLHILETGARRGARIHLPSLGRGSQAALSGHWGMLQPSDYTERGSFSLCRRRRRPLLFLCHRPWWARPRGKVTPSPRHRLLRQLPESGAGADCKGGCRSWLWGSSLQLAQETPSQHWLTNQQGARDACAARSAPPPLPGKVLPGAPSFFQQRRQRSGQLRAACSGQLRLSRSLRRRGRRPAASRRFQLLPKGFQWHLEHAQHASPRKACVNYSSLRLQG